MHRTLVAPWFILASTVVALGALLSLPAAATADRLPSDMTSKELTDLFERQRSSREAFLRGTQSPGDSDKPIIDTMAKWYTNRLTWPDPPKPGDMDRQVREFEDQVLREALANKENNQAFLKLFNQQMMEQLRKVLQNDSMAVRISGGRILAREGRLGQEGLADLLTEILGDKNQSEAVKFYALQGVQELFTATRPKPEDRENHCIQAVLDFLSSKSTLGETMSQPETDGVRYLRRTAIRALGQTRVPAIDKDKGNTALTLLRTVARDPGVTPAPSLAEQTEAAIGIAQLQSKLTAGYQADYAANLIGNFLVDFAQKYELDRPNPVKTQPWKVDAARLRIALETMRTDTADPYVAGLADKASALLRIIEGGDQQSDTTALRTYLDAKPATLGTSLFKGDDKSVVTPSTGS